jgi:hypothetical protein
MSELVKRLRTLDGLRCPTARELEAAARIEQLEAAHDATYLRGWNEGIEHALELARAALDQSSPPARQENDDVYPGFRGNNEA